MSLKSLLSKSLMVIGLAIASLAVADNQLASDSFEIRDTQIEKIDIKQQNIPNNEDLLRKQNIESPQSEQTEFATQNSEETQSQARALEKEFAYRLAMGNKSNLNKFIELYRQVEERDESLIEWAEAMLLAEKDLDKSIRAYRVLAAKFAENDFIRFQLASALFYNQEFDAAQEQFQKLRASSTVSKTDIALFDQYLEQIANKSKWNFSFGAQYLNDKNITDSADVGTTVVLPNGGTLTQENPKETGRGINYNLGANKQWSFSNGRYVQLDSEINHKYYWDNKKFNELTAYVSTGVGYADARLTLQATPYAMQRWYAGGFNSENNKLKAYTQTTGVSLLGSYWVKPNVKYTASYSGSYDRYRDDSLAKRYNGLSQTVSNNAMWLTSPKQYWGLGVDLTKRNAKDKINSYTRANARVFWGQEWPKGFATRTSVSVAKRNYREANFLGKQKNTEYKTSVSVWNKAVHFKGFTPRLTFSYEKTKSNIPLYSFDKKQAFIEVDKTF